MASLDEQVLRATKEIVVKFIEGGRISPVNPAVYPLLAVPQWDRRPLPSMDWMNSAAIRLPTRLPRLPCSILR